MSEIRTELDFYLTKGGERSCFLTIRRLPHLFQVELLHTLLVRGDRGALDADVVLLDRVRTVDRHLIAGRIAILDAQVEADHLAQVDEWQQQFLLDQLPDDLGHLVTCKLAREGTAISSE